MTEVAFFKDGKRVATRTFRVSKDETLWYRTMVAARDYAEENGFDSFKLDGDMYASNGRKLRKGERI